MSLHNRLKRVDFSSDTSDFHVSNFTFILFIYFVVDFFLRFSARLPAYGVFRPTLLLIAILVFLIFLQKDKFRSQVNDPIFTAYFAILFYIFLTIPFVEWPGSVIKSNLDPFVKASIFLFFVGLFVDSVKRLKIFIFVFVACQIFRVLEPLVLNITTGYWGSATYLSSHEFANRLSGAPADVINPNELGFVIVTIIPFLHYLLFPLGWKSKLIYLILMPALLYALILTMSRGGFIALLVVGFFIFKSSENKAKLLFAGVISIMLAFSVMTPVQKERYLSLIDRDAEGGSSADGRIRGMVREFELGLTRPVFGHGLGTTPEAKTHKLGERQASHNLYAELLIEIGLIGMFLFLGFLSRIIRRLSYTKSLIDHEDRSPFFKGLNKSLIALFWMYAIYSINYWGLSQYYWYFFAGLVIAFSRLIESSSEIENPDPSSAGSRIDDRYSLARSIKYKRN